MNFSDIEKRAVKDFKQAQSEQQLEQARVEHLGRKSELAELMRQLPKLSASERAKQGAAANQLRVKLERALEQALRSLHQAQWERDTKLDLSQPTKVRAGHHHPVTSLMDETVRLFWQLGFTVVNGPELEEPYYNFDALNIPADHPSRDMQDTFYLEDGRLPRTHTSNMQIRFMQEHQPPIRIISPGKVYRNEDEDPTHLWMFHQVEGLVVDQGIGLADLKGTLLYMTRGLLGEQTEIRLRQSYFPYTEPSVEVDATCSVCAGKGCHTCSGTGWIELLGAGMVHPQVLVNCGIDPEVYSGFAFGVGLERIAAIRHQVPDIRYFWRPDLRFLEQF